MKGKQLLMMLAVASVSASASGQVYSEGVSGPDTIQIPSTSASLKTVEQQKVKTGKSDYIPVFQYWKEHDILQHLDISLTAGTTGIGIDVASPIGEYVQVRAGYEIMPRFNKSMNFDLTIGGKPARMYDPNGNRIETTFDRLKDMLYDFTGYDIDDHIEMIGKPTINNAKLLVDVFPFKNNKNWHFTAGLYWGPSQFAEAVNSTEAMVSLVSVGIYNRMYEKALNGEAILNPTALGIKGAGNYQIEELNEKLLGFGRLGFAVGRYKNDVYTTAKRDIFDDNGNLLHAKGETYVLYKAGDPYILEPDGDGLVRVKAKSKALKPYLGFGYGGRLLKNNDDWKVSFDCGAMFWGGTPDLYVHDGMNLTKDVENVTGQVGTYVDMFKSFKVFPVLSLRLTKRIF